MNKEREKIKLQCDASGLHYSWLYTENVPDDFSEQEKKTHAYFKSLWDKTFEEEEEIALRSADLKLEEEDILHHDDLILSTKSPLISAEKLAALFKWNGMNTIHYCGDAFWLWNGHYYNDIKINYVRKIIYNFLKKAKTHHKDQNNNSSLIEFAPNKGKVDQVLDALKAICDLNCTPESGASWIDDRDFPPINNIIIFKNGILNIEEWIENKNLSLSKHTPLLLNSSYLPFDFCPDDKEPHEWLKFLNSLWPNDRQSIATLQEFFGYYLTQATKYHKILLLVGPPRSGKGTIARILRAMLGEENVIGPTLASLASPFGLQQWLNKSLAIISDARLSGKDHSVITERLLSVSGEDPLTIDRKHRDAITAKLPTRIMIMTNELPNIADTSSALANRYIILSLTNSWLGKEDPDLENRIRPELPQILPWALQGIEPLRQRNRFIQPNSAQQHIDELMAMTSPIKMFISECCEVGPMKYIETNTLFKRWARWCEENGYEKAGNLQAFGRNLRTVMPHIKITRPRTEYGESRTRMRVYEGIGLSILSNV